MNKVILMGRLTRDPEVRVTQGENATSVARYTLAVDRRGRDNNTADFISCVAFRGGAEFAEKYLRQGTKIVVVGRLQTGSYTNKDGNKVYTTDVVVEEHYFAESKGSGSNNSSKAPAAATSNSAPATSNPDGFMNIPDGIDEEIPFS